MNAECGMMNKKHFVPWGFFAGSSFIIHHSSLAAWLMSLLAFGEKA